MPLATTYDRIKDALAARLATSTTLSVVYSEPQDRIITPSAQILPGNPTVEYYQTMGNGLNLFRFVVLVCVQRFETISALNRLDEYIFSTTSIANLVAADPTLGGSVQTSVVTRCSNLGMVQSGEDAYLGAEYDVEVYL